jgi:hypothetical protein
MALARCQTCGSPKGLKQNYPHFHTLAHSGNIDILCGSPTCARPGCLWLTDEEQLQYLHGQRSFRMSNRTMEVPVA